MNLSIEHGVYLAGDSYPADAKIEQAIKSRFEPLARTWTGQAALIERSGEATMVKPVHLRVEGLKALFPQPVDARDAVLFGRSSGARTATKFASRRPVRAVIALGYPFRNPKRHDQPARYLHLADLNVPTLIFQGVNDTYGGRSVADDYRLSPAIQLRFLEADHRMLLDAEGWAFVERETRAFLSGLS